VTIERIAFFVTELAKIFIEHGAFTNSQHSLDKFRRRRGQPR